MQVIGLVTYQPLLSDVESAVLEFVSHIIGPQYDVIRRTSIKGIETRDFKSPDERLESSQ
jgi:hypothetical protein